MPLSIATGDFQAVTTAIPTALSTMQANEGYNCSVSGDSQGNASSESRGRIVRDQMAKLERCGDFVCELR